MDKAWVPGIDKGLRSMVIRSLRVDKGLRSLGINKGLRRLETKHS